MDRPPRRLKRLAGGALLIAVAFVIGVAIFAPKLLVALLVLYVTILSAAVAIWIWRQFP